MGVERAYFVAVEQGDSDGSMPIFARAGSYEMNELGDTIMGSWGIGLLLLHARWLPSTYFLIT